MTEETLRVRAGGRDRPHCRFAPPVIHNYSRIYSVPLFLKRRCDRTPLPQEEEEGGELPAEAFEAALKETPCDIGRRCAVQVIALDVKVILTSPCMFH
jgi:hypothetical protein